uniref:Uncharacterized protein n=1 Tax=Aplanochytrium stocchinoi TaxID=215587 RepID=A0A6S8BU75_9STRA|mmetsp:Transcript_36385/g.45468  ORF Transcript_36385/g.45468 Transcript_36385/m.45468 type:complete len:190 (+) Transcript_36385:99-668(+)
MNKDKTSQEGTRSSDFRLMTAESTEMKRKSCSSNKIKRTSFQVFRTFITYPCQRGAPDVSKVFSTECFDEWLRTRAKLPKNPEKTFRRALTAHVCGTNGCSPFTDAEERALLKFLRRKDSSGSVFVEQWENVGKKGFWGVGYHEKTRNDGTSSLLAKLRARRCTHKMQEGDDKTQGTNAEPVNVAKLIV